LTAQEKKASLLLSVLRSPVFQVSRPGSVCGFGCCYCCLSIQTKNNEKLFNKNYFEGKNRTARKKECRCTEAKSLKIFKI